MIAIESERRTTAFVIIVNFLTPPFHILDNKRQFIHERNQSPETDFIT